MTKLRRLKIEEFRHVAAGTELHFRDSLNLLLGKNGSGKTTLLNLIVMALRGDFTEILEEPFQLEYELEADQDRIEVRLRNTLRFSSVGFPPPSGQGTVWGWASLSGQGTGWGDSVLTRANSGARPSVIGEITLSGPNFTPPITVSFEGERVVIRTPEKVLKELTDFFVGPSDIANLPDIVSSIQLADSGESYGPAAARLMTVFGVNYSVKRLDESLELLTQAISNSRLFSARNIPQPGQLRGGLLFFGDCPVSILGQANVQLTQHNDADEIRLSTKDDTAEFLSKFIRLVGLDVANAKLARTARRPIGYTEEVDFGNLRFEFSRRDRSILSYSHLSYGQKRLLAFYYQLAFTSPVVVADELVNGMHHEWIEACLEDLSSRQAFLTSQNPLLLDYLSFETAKEVQSSFVLCRNVTQDERTQLTWENMSAEEAQGFFDAYQVGIQHVSEILRTRGLW
ncbi:MULTISPECIES: AAA family ATPase [unclassified Corallococcus]|uniref:AAA family ATPase n=1 Tax=unclassified Corallococcus TaxID=2685029 RepID=UPI001A8DC0AB|nr:MULTISPECIES: AAA family ATPase [unclassified Corallococcus]MBN9681785.1 AAA family ATPase [Corallococcus sp. NCSPR001]WAS86645.1 AAA family ATPase [Corallococcus sp. NCRR]